MQIDTITVPKKGDLVLVQEAVPANRVQAFKVAEVKIVDEDTEIILQKRNNIWFSWNAYMTGKSWVTDCRVVTP